MYTVNLERIRKDIKDKKIPQYLLCEKLKMSASTLATRLSGMSDWKMREIFTLCELLQYSVTDIVEVFFCPES